MKNIYEVPEADLTRFAPWILWQTALQTAKRQNPMMF